MTINLTKIGNDRATRALKLIWLPVSVLGAGQLYLHVFMDYGALFVCMFSIGLGALLALIPISAGIRSLFSHTQYVGKAIAAILIPVASVALSFGSFAIIGG